MYGYRNETVNSLRYKLYCSKNGKIGSEQLHPCKNVLIQHANRACYQTKTWKSALLSDPETLSPYEGYGRLLNNNELHIEWFTCKPAPEQCLDLISCSCQKKCLEGSCCCIDNMLPCTDVCY